MPTVLDYIFPKIPPQVNNNNLPFFVSGLSAFVPVICLTISIVCLYLLSKHYLSLQFAKNLELKTQNERNNQTLNSIFYKLLESKNGCVTPLELALLSGFDSMIVSNFLIQKVRDFGAKSLLSTDGDVVWKFDYLTENELLEIKRNG